MMKTLHCIALISALLKCWCIYIKSHVNLWLYDKIHNIFIIEWIFKCCIYKFWVFVKKE